MDIKISTIEPTGLVTEVQSFHREDHMMRSARFLLEVNGWEYMILPNGNVEAVNKPKKEKNE